MSDKIKPCPESLGKSYCPRHKREGQRRVGFRCICAELEVAWILGAGSRTPDARLEAERAVIEAAKVLVKDIEADDDGCYDVGRLKALKDSLAALSSQLQEARKETERK